MFIPNYLQSPKNVMKEPVKKAPPPQSVQAQKSPPVQKKHVREAPPVRHEDVQEGGDTRGLHDVADGAAVPFQDGDVGGAVHVPVEKGPDELVDDAPGVGYTRPRRPPKPNPKYNPEVFDLSYVGVRKRSKKSIRRVGR